jgi:GNAT superfamily N-acetyltransferase
VVSELALARVVDEVGLQGWHHVVQASSAADFEAFPADPIDDIRPALTGLYNSEEVQLWVGSVGDRPVVATEVGFPVHDNLTLSKVRVHVHPDHRRQGLGRQAADVMLDVVRDRGRITVHVGVPAATTTADPSAGVALATSLGARRLLVEKRWLLDLEALAPHRLEALDRDARQASSGYVTVAWRDHTPAKHVADMAALTALMSTDQPQGDLDLEPESWDSERYLERERSIVERGRHRFVVAALERVSGHVIAYTDVAVPGGGATVGYQWDTIVRSDHRGHRLGMLVKLANLAELRRALPDLRYLNTWSADENAYMIAVNSQIGYREMEGWSEWQLDL